MFDSLIKAIQDGRVANIYQERFTDKPLQRLPQRSIDSLVVRSLDGLIEYCKSLANPESDSGDWFVHVDSHSTVYVVGLSDLDSGYRPTFLQASLDDTAFNFNAYHEREKFQIGLMTRFERTAPRNTLIEVVGKVSDEEIKQTDDDGISQTVTVRKGITLKGEIVVDPIIGLKPYRTFLEVEQPESSFVLRMKSERQEVYCALFEADGGAWKHIARQNIKDYLRQQLGDNVVILG